MNKDFIPYEQALELKELGFDEPCCAGYYEIQGNVNLWYCKESKNSDKDEIEKDEFAMAPLYQQAFKWFREKHRLYHVINMFGDWDKPQYSYIVSGKTMGNPAHMWYYEDVDSYEKAELICLNKLIEIIKNKFGGLEK